MKHFSKSIANASQLLLAILVGGLIGSYFQSPALAIGTTAVISAPVLINYKMTAGALFSSLDITKLTTVLGDYCRENRDILVTNVLLDDTDDRFTLLEDVTDEVALPSLDIADIVKPANPLAFDPTSNALKFGARTLKVRACKVDIELVPQILEKTWLGKMKNPSDPFDMPFEEYIMQMIIKKAKENIRLKAIYKGIYNAAGTTPGDTMDGFDTLIAAEIAASNPNVVSVTTGAITATNIADKLQLVYDDLGDPYKDVQTICDLPSQFFDWYVRKFQPVINPTLVVTNGAAAMNYPVVKEVPLIGTNAILRREPGKATNKPFFFTPKENMYKGVDSTIANIDVQKFNRTIKVLVDFKVGVNFAQLFDGALALNVAV